MVQSAFTDSLFKLTAYCFSLFARNQGAKRHRAAPRFGDVTGPTGATIPLRIAPGGRDATGASRNSGEEGEP